MPAPSPAPHRVRWAVEQLAPLPADRVLEVGCGPGHAVALVCPRLVAGTITAIDRSALQVAKARARNAAWIARGRARIERVALEEAAEALGHRAFDRILAVNVNAFWTDPAPSLAHLSGLLAPGGRAYLVWEPPGAGDLARTRTSVGAALSAHGFAIDEVLTGPQTVCFVGTPATG